MKTTVTGRTIAGPRTHRFLQRPTQGLDLAVACGKKTLDACVDTDYTALELRTLATWPTKHKGKYMKTPDSKEHALDLSIKKYKKLQKYTQMGFTIHRDEISAESCACCEYDDAQNLLSATGGTEVIECGNCLVYKYTGQSDCKDTPWVDLYALLNSKVQHDKTTILEHIEDEIDFLKKVRKTAKK